MTRMSRLAATDHGADWVIPATPTSSGGRGAGSLAGILEAVPGRFGVVRGLMAAIRLPLQGRSPSSSA